MKKRGLFILTVLLAIGWMGVIFAFSSQSGADSSETSGRVMQYILRFIEPEFHLLDRAAQVRLQDTVTFFVRKGAHFTEYLILGLLLFLLFYQWNSLRTRILTAEGSQVRKRRKVLLLTAAWGIATVYAATDEFHQMFSDERTPGLRDVCIDSAGAAAGVFAAAAMVWICKRIVRKQRLRLRQEENL